MFCVLEVVGLYLEPQITVLTIFPDFHIVPCYSATDYPVYILSMFIYLTYFIYGHVFTNVDV